jgi:uncharacterized cupredoxin-like copper-binding protein
VQFAQAFRVALAAAAVGVGLGLLFHPGSGHAVASGRPAVKVTERDFGISVTKYVRAGEVTLSVTNRGPDTHELIVVRSNGRPLALRSDGLTIDETRIESRKVGSLEGAGPHITRTLRVHLTPGRYVLLCNMAGHYLGGMHSVLVVR